MSVSSLSPSPASLSIRQYRRYRRSRGLTASVLVAALATAVPLAAPPSPQAATARAQPAQTALDRYVAAPDPNFSWKIVRDLQAEGVTATLLEMTSQQWLTDKEVERPLWTHWITIARPEKVTSNIGLLFISGGSNDRPPPARPPAWLVEVARETGTVTAELASRAEPAGGFQGRSFAETALGRRFHCLYLGQVPAHRRREVAGAPADDEERRSRHGRGDGIHRIRRRRGQRGDAVRRVWRIEARMDDVDDGRYRSPGRGYRAGGDRHAECRAVIRAPLARVRRLV